MKYNGQILSTLVTMFLPVIGILRMSIDPEDGGGDGGVPGAEADHFLDALTGNETSPDSAKGGKSPAPAVEKDGSGEPANGEKPNQPDPAKAKDPAVVTDDELKDTLGFGETPEAKAQRLARDYQASSKEAIRLATREKLLAEKLEAQGIKIVDSEDGKSVELVPVKGHKDSAKAEAMRIDVTKLGDDAVMAFESGDLKAIQKEIDKISETITKSLVRPMPTSDEPVQKLSVERIDAVLAEMQEASDLNGNRSYPGIEKNGALIKHMLNDPTIPKDMRDAFHKHPREMARWMNALVMVEKSKLQAARNKAGDTAQQKKEAGRKIAQVGVEGGGTVYSQDGSSERTLIDLMVKA